MTDGISAAAVLELLVERPRVLALGEPTHGEEALLGLRNDLFRELVEQAGYRTIAIESDCLRGAVVDRYVRGSDDDEDDVLARGFSHEWGAFPGNRELVRWMRAHNDGRPEAEQVRFAGFDGPLEITGAESPRVPLIALHEYLAERVDPDLLPCTAETLDHLLGADDRWTNPAAMMDPAQSIGRSPDAQQLRLLADDLVALSEAQSPDLPDREDLTLHGRTATGLLSYHYWMADTSPGRLARLLGVRDSMMAANLRALAAQGPLLVSAHNGHLQRDKSSMQMGGRVEWWSAGAILSTQLGDQYAFLATAVGTIRHRGVDIPPADTIEGRLYAGAKDRYVVEPATVHAPAARVSPWFGYAPLDPAHVARIDGILFIKDA